MSISTHSASFFWLLSSLALGGVIIYPAQAQSKNPALGSMGANLGKQNWKAAIQWALKAAEADPNEKYWRYLNAAEFCQPR